MESSFDIRGNLWSVTDTSRQRWSIHISPRVVRALVPLACYVAILLVSHGIHTVWPDHLASAASDTYLCKRH
jgi:hypothetical protein